MASRQINPDTYNVGFTDAQEGRNANPPFSTKEDIEQYMAGYFNGTYADEVADESER